MVAGRWDICKLLVGQKNLPAVYNAGRFITRISHELLSRDHEDGRATGQLVPRSRGIGSEAHLNGTSQGPTPEDARKDGHIRGRSK
jgi:hypothetical protein